jgi:hypothetical protein
VHHEGGDQREADHARHDHPGQPERARHPDLGEAVSRIDMTEPTSTTALMRQT